MIWSSSQLVEAIMLTREEWEDKSLEGKLDWLFDGLVGTVTFTHNVSAQMGNVRKLGQTTNSELKTLAEKVQAIEKALSGGAA